jgi:prepilin-type N-terminal cleavage/methylation domain-containing protein
MPTKTRHGFTLIELMIGVCIIGVLASVAVPTYTRFMMESKAAEGTSTLGMLYRGAVAYWESTNAEKGLGATASGHCVASSLNDPAGSGIPPLPPTPYKRKGDYTTSPLFNALGYSPSDPVLFIPFPISADEAADPCTYPDGPAYHMIAVSDLDGDGIYGGSYLGVGIRNGQLYRAPGFGSLQDFFGIAYGGACPYCGSGVE